MAHIENILAFDMVLASLVLVYAVVFIVCYLIGAIPTGYLVVKAKTGKDIRTLGSGSTGATNVKRELGTKWFYIVMLIDAFKGLIPVLFVKHFIAFNSLFDILSVIAALALVIGHTKPIYLAFRGGKSVATGVGTLIGLNWIVGLSVALIWAVIAFVSKYVSLGSVLALCCAPIILYLLHNPISYVIYSILLALFIVYTHRENIVRLMKGAENKVR